MIHAGILLQTLPLRRNAWWILIAFQSALPAAESVTLQLNPASAHEAEVHALDGGGFSILTTGGDPFVTTHALPEGAVPGDAFILEFEYFCPDGLDHFEVFFGPPIRPGASAKSGPCPLRNSGDRRRLT